MHLLDIVFLVPILWALYRGYKKGLIIEITSLVSLVLGVYGAIKLSGVTGQYLTEYFNMSEQNLGIVSFAVTFILIVGLIYFIGKMIEKMIDLVALSFVNKLGGAFFSGLKVAMIISIILVTLNGWNEKYNFLPDSVSDDSMFFEPLTKLSPTVMPFLQNSEWVQKGLEKLKSLKEESGVDDMLEG
ncbi:MAG: membrane protein required for colicin V production [Patiriisocius sp.]|jgi:membrane protein required for colicin V production